MQRVTHKILVIGCGSIGQRHIRNLLGMEAGDIVAFDPRADRRAEVAAAFGVTVVTELSAAWRLCPTIALIAAPSSLHASLALEAVGHNCDLFVEKPLAHTHQGVAELLAEVARTKKITMVGSNFKFQPSFVKMKQMLAAGVLGRVLSVRCQFGHHLPDWHPWEDYRQTYSARASLGGGILLDSHEFDYMRWFFGEIDEVFCMAGKLSDLEIDTEDTAEVLLRFQSGCFGSMHLDYTQRAYQRNYEIFGDQGTLKWDFNDRRLWLYRAANRSWEVFEEPRGYDLNTMYVEEMRHFLKAVEQRQETLSDVFNAWRTLQAVLAAKRSARDKCAVKPAEEC